ncbi:hypothetical protein GYMLUDRAFT_241112 [Collybiopsis luxurians FD-317 M1]|nr:hypothetical protein GYMLUDRAFT_241112 [Collybiopsis luxurians FD-317 M1]
MQWDSLEQTLHIFLKACHSLSPTIFDAGFHFWAYPRQFGYSAAWQREEIARKVAINSCSAFIPLLAAVSFLLHSSGAARVYFWLLDQGHRVCNSAGRRDQEDTWNAYTPNQHHYDLVANEWDLCSLFTLGETANIDDVDDEDEYRWNPPVDDREISLPEDGSTLAEGFLRQNVSCTSDDKSIEFLEAIDDVVFHYFGYIGANDSDEQVFSQDIWNNVLREVGYGQKYMPDPEALKS